MVSAERGGRILFELCRGDGVTIAGIRQHADFMRSLRTTGRCVMVRYGGDHELWAEAALDVIDCVTSTPDQSGLGRRAARFMRACLGLDGEMGGLEQRMRELQNSQFKFPTSLKTLRDDRLKAMIRLCRVLNRITAYACEGDAPDIDDAHLRAIRVASKFIQMFAHAISENVSEETIDNALKSINSELPGVSQNYSGPNSTYELRKSGWNRMIEFFAREIYADVAGILVLRGHKLRDYDAVMWSLRIARRSGRIAVERFREDISIYAFAACMAFVEELWVDAMREELIAYQAGESAPRLLDREALADLVDNFIREKYDKLAPVH